LKEFKLTDIKISDIELDSNNPNQLSKKQKTVLPKLMDRFGFLVPIVIDEKTMKVIDGEHRIIARKQLGYETVQGFIIDTTKEDYDRRLLRQVLNKFHGEPDPEKDIEDLEYIREDETGAAMLDEFLDIDADTLKDMNEGLEEESGGTGEDKDDQADKMRKVVLYFTKIEYPEIKEKFDRLKEDYQVTTETEVVKALLEHRESSL
jgi:hypothetical protein